MEKKFIKTTDEETATKLIACGFKLVSHIGCIDTFLNEIPMGFTFDTIDKNRIAYDNKLSI